MKFPLILLTTAGLLQAIPLPRQSENARTVEMEAPVTCAPSRFIKPSVYKFETTVENKVMGTSEESTGMSISGKLSIKPVEKCSYVLKVYQGKIHESVAGKNVISAEKSKALQMGLNKDLIFTVDGGKITEIKIHKADNEQSVNIKRGLLSSLQLDVSSNMETDIHGKCPVAINKAKKNRVIKLKNMNDCEDRVQNQMGFQSTSFSTEQNPIQPLNSTSFCEYKIEKFIQKVACTEKHIFRPFSAGYKKDAGAITTVSQTLVLIRKMSSQRAAIKTDKYQRVSSLIYNHDQDAMTPTNDLVTEFGVLMERLVSADNKRAKQHSAREFMELVKLIREMDGKRLKDIWFNYFNCDTKNNVCKPGDGRQAIYRQYLLDAMTYCGTETCIDVMRKGIEDGVVTGERMNSFLQGIVLVKKPTQAMIRDVLDIVKKLSKKQELPRQAMLTLGTLLRRLCVNDNPECHYGQKNPVTKAENFLTGILGGKCHVHKKDDYARVEKIILALKAIKNYGNLERSMTTLVKCAKNQHQYTNISIAAFDALSTMPCNHDLDMELLAYLNDINNDPERRIHAFQAIARCKNRENFQEVIKTLNNEKNNQVASYIYSYLTSLRDSNNPKYKEYSELIKNLTTVIPLREVDSSVFQHSKAFKKGFQIDQLNSGVHAEADTIFHSDSYIPRSLRTRLAANVLGVDLNLFEMYARVEGLETLIEQLFSPNGAYPDVMSLFNIKIDKDTFYPPQAKMRNRRNVSPEQHDKQLKGLFRRTGAKEQQPAGHLSLRLFGQEVRLVSYEDLAALLDQAANNVNIIELMTKLAKGGDVSFSKSQIILDLTHTVPTGAGLPLNLKLESSAVASIEMSGKVDIRNMFWGPKKLDVYGSLRPSAVVDLTAKMGVSGPFVDSGIFVNSSIYMDHFMKGKIEYQEGKKLQISVDPPKEPVTVFNISTTPYLYSNSKNIPVMSKTRVDIDKTATATNAVGLGLQFTAGFPTAYRDYEAPYSPLNGPAYLGVKLFQTDPTLTTYQFLVAMKKMSQNGVTKYTADISLSTPKTKIVRSIGAKGEYTISTNDHRVLLTSNTKYTKLNLEGKYNSLTNTIGGKTQIEIPALGQYGKFASEFTLFNETAVDGRAYGLKTTVSVFEKTEFSNVFRFNKKNSGFSLESIVNYFNEKKFETSLEWNRDLQTVKMLLSSNQLEQSVELLGELIKKSGFQFTAKHLPSGKNVKFFTGLDIKPESTMAVFRADVLGKQLELKAGRVMTNGEAKLMTTLNLNKEEMFNVFLVYMLNKEYTLDAGLELNKNVYGSKIDLSRPGQYCIEMYRNNEGVTSTPFITCVNYEYELAKRTGKVSWTTTTTLTKSKFESEVLAQMDSWNFKTSATSKMNGSTIFIAQQELSLNGVWDSKLSAKVELGKYNAKYSIASRDTNGAKDIDFSVEAMDKPVSLNMAFSKKSWFETNVKTTATIVNKRWELMTTTLIYGCKAEEAHLGVNMETFFGTEYKGNYALEYHMENGKHRMLESALFSKKDFSLIGANWAINFDWNAKTLDMTNELKLSGKSYKVAFDFGFKDDSSDSQKQYILRADVTYAPNRKSGVRMVFIDNSLTTRLNMVVTYVPKKSLRHTFEWTKEENKLDLEIEFLPNMFAQYRGSYKDGKVRSVWNFKTPFKSYGLDISGMMAQKTFNTKIVLSASSDIHLQVDVDIEKPKAIIELNLYHGKKYWISLSKKDSTTWSLQLINLTQTLAAADIRKSNKGNFLDLKVLGNSLLKFFYEKSTDSRSIMGIDYKSGKILNVVTDFTKNRMLSQVDISGKRLFKVTFDNAEAEKVMQLFVKDKKALELRAIVQFPTYRIQIISDLVKFIGEATLKKENENYRMDLKINDYPISFIAFDPRKMLGVQIITKNGKRTGMRVVYDKPEKILLLEVLSKEFRVITKLQNDILISALEYSLDEKEFVTAMKLSYDLQQELSKIRFEWNEQIIKYLKSMTMEKFNQLLSKYTPLTKELRQKVTTFVKNQYQKIDEQVKMIVEKVKGYIENMDIKDLQKKMFVSIDELITKSSNLSAVVLKDLKEQLKLFKARIPELKTKFTEMITQVNGVFTKVVSEIKRTNNTIAWFLLKNKPIVDATVQILKEFKIRDQTLEQLYSKLLDIITTKGTEIYMNGKVKAIDAYRKVIQYVLSIRVPCNRFVCNKTVQETLVELKKLTKNYNFSYTAMKVYQEIMNIKILEKKIQEHILNVQVFVKSIPAKVKPSLKIALRKMREVELKLKEIYSKVDQELKPLVEYLKLVYKTLNDNYSPLFAKMKRSLKSMSKNNLIFLDLMKKMKTYKEFANKMIMPVYANVKLFSDTVMEQLKNFKIIDDTMIIDMYNTMVSRMEKAREFIMSQVKDMKMAIKSIRSEFTGISDDEFIDKLFEMIPQSWEKFVLRITEYYKKIDFTPITNKWNEVKALYKTLMEGSFEDKKALMIQKLEDVLQKGTDYLILLVEQIEKTQIAEPVRTLLGKIDIFLQNIDTTKITNMIKGMKKRIEEVYNKVSVLRDSALTEIRALQKKLSVVLVKVLDRLSITLNYISSLPDKEFTEVYGDYVQLRQMAFKRIQSYAIKIVEIIKDSGIELKKLKKTLDMVSQVIFNDIIPKTNEWVESFVIQSKQIYKVLKPETIRVFNLYKKKVLKAYKPTIDLIVRKYEEAVQEINKYVEKVKNFIDANKNITLEILLQKIESKVNEILKPMQTNMVELKTKVINIYFKAVSAMQTLKDQIELELTTKIVPELKRLWNLAIVKSTRFYVETKNTLLSMKSKMVKLYSDYKTKTPKELIEILRKVLTDKFNAKYADMKAKYEKEYKRINDLVADFIIPEAKREFLSILEQTLRAEARIQTVVLEVYGPYLQIADKWLREKITALDMQIKELSTKFLKVKLPVFVRLANEQIQNIVRKYSKLITESAIKFFESKMYIQARNNENVVAALAQVESIAVKIAPYFENYPQLTNRVVNVWNFMKNPQVDILRNVMSKIQSESQTFGENAVIKITGVLSSVNVDRLPSLMKLIELMDDVKEQLELFRNEPVRYFWQKVNATKMYINYLRQMDVLLQIRNILDNVKQTTTEQWQKLKKFIISLDVSGRIGQYMEMLTALKEKYQMLATEKLNKLGEQISDFYTGSIIQEIVNNQIWGDIASEIKMHPIVKDLQEAIPILKDLLNLKYSELKLKVIEIKTTIQVFVNSKWEELIPKWKGMIISKLNDSTALLKNLYAETTIEDMVKTIKEKYTVVYSAIEKFYNVDVAKLLTKAENMIKELKVKVLLYSELSFDKLKKLRDEYYPKLQMQWEKIKDMAVEKYNELKPYVLKYKGMTVTKFNELKELVLKKWDIYKKLTVFDIKSRIENFVKEQTAEAKKIFEKIELMKYLTPIKVNAQRIITSVNAIVKEIKATTEFAIEYYHLKERFDGLMSQMRTMAEKFPQLFDECSMKTCFGVDMKKNIQKMERQLLETTHNMLVYLKKKGIVLRNYVPKIETYLVTLKKYIPTVTRANGFIEVTFPHPFDVKGTFKYNVKIVNSTIYKVIEKVKEIKPLEKVKVLANNLKTDMKSFIALSDNFIKSIRDDAVILFNKNKEVINRVVAYVKQLWVKYEKIIRQKLVEYKSNFSMTLEKIKMKIRTLFEDLKMKVMGIYQKVLDFCKSGKAQDLYTLLETVQKELTSSIERYTPIIRKFISEKYNLLLSKMGPWKMKLMGLYEQVKGLILEVWNGKSLTSVLKPYHEQLLGKMNETMDKVKIYVNKAVEDYKKKMSPEVLRVMEDYFETHKNMFDKYSSVIKFYGKFGAFLTSRIQRMIMRNINAENLVPVTGMTHIAAYLGNGQMITFDNKFHKYPMNFNKKCRYVLATDAASKDFTLSTEQNSVTIATTDLLINIIKGGKVVSHVKSGSGKPVKTLGLPVEGKSGWCVRNGNQMECYFKESQFRVVVDLDNFVTVVATNLFNYGDIRGLLGSNNGEQYDDVHNVKRKVIASSMNVLNSFEMTRKAGCRVNRAKPVERCNVKPSERCEAWFKDSKSLFSPYFSATLKPEPFYEACLKDTADCANKKTANPCKMASAFTIAVTQMNGYTSTMVPECNLLTYKKAVMKVGDDFVAKPNKQLDVVLIVSLRSFVEKKHTQIVEMLRLVKNKLKRMNVNYAVVGFGGKGVHENAHVHTTLNGKVFTDNFRQVKNILLSLPYTGSVENRNDVFDAVSYAGNLNYRPGSTRVYIMFNADAHKAAKFSGASALEASFSLTFESNASLILFDKLKFKDLGNKPDVVSQTGKEIFVGNGKQSVIKVSEEFPVTPLGPLVKESKGAMFDIVKLDKPPRIASFLFKILENIRVKECQKCKVYQSMCSRQQPCNASPARATCYKKQGLVC